MPSSSANLAHQEPSAGLANLLQLLGILLSCVGPGADIGVVVVGGGVVVVLAEDVVVVEIPTQ
jgi:hypothetical protein